MPVHKLRCSAARRDPGGGGINVARVVRRHNDAFTSLLTHGLFDHTEVGAEGSLVKLHLTATLDQIETLMTLVGGFLGVQPPGSGGPTVPPGSPTSRGSR